MLTRALGRALAALQLIALLPVAVVIGLAIRIESRGPVLVLHKQVRGGRPISVLAFRTETIDLESGERRPTRVGDVLRRTGLDELPELLNILRGDSPG